MTFLTLYWRLVFSIFKKSMDCLFTEQDLQHNVKGQREDTGIKNPFLNHSVHLNISMHILQTVPYTFPEV